LWPLTAGSSTRPQGWGARFRAAGFVGSVRGDGYLYSGGSSSVKRYLAALTCCGLLSLSACSDDSSSSADPPTTAPTSASSDPTSTPTEEGETPEEFLVHWIELNTSMQNTGNVAEFRKISAKCRSCLDTADQVKLSYEAGRQVK